MALKETNKSRTKIDIDELQKDVEDNTCGYVTRLVFGPLLIIGAVLFIANILLLPLL